MDIIVIENVVYVFVYLGYLEEVVVLGFFGCIYKKEDNNLRDFLFG